MCMMCPTVTVHTPCVLLPRHPTTIHNQNVSVHIIRCVRRQEHRDTLHGPPVFPSVLPVSWSRIALLRSGSSRNACVLFVAMYPGAIALTVMPGSRPLVRQGLGHLCHGTLAGGIRRHDDPTLKRQQRSNVDDLAVLALHHVPADGLTQEEDGLAVDRQDVVPVLLA